MKEIAIEYERPENLIPYHHNSKLHSDEQILRICSSIAEFGFDQPIVVDKNKVIIKGHGRREAAIKLGLKQVPIVIADHLDEYQVKAARIADNKTSSTEYNQEFLKFDLGTLHLADYNLSLTSIPELELTDLMKDIDQFDYNGVMNRDIASNNENNDIKNIYTEKIETPIYEPNGDKPSLNDLIDLNKYKSLCNEIEQSNLNKEEKEFLKFAASRHIIFNYEKIANYYAHSDKSVQELFENSALVIIDFNKAIENGFVKLSKEMNDNYINNEEYDDEN